MIVIGLVVLMSFEAICQKAVSDYRQTTWTYTYLKALNGESKKLEDFIRLNWFAMDSIAVNEGLIKSYQLIQNMDESADWNLIVAVEYYTENTYSDIATEFEEIRKNHKQKKVAGKGLALLGEIIKSEVVQIKE